MTNRSSIPDASHGAENAAQDHNGGLLVTIIKKAAIVVVAGLTIYLGFPAITEVLASWPRLSSLEPAWIALAIAFELGHFTCTFALQRLALGRPSWFPVVTSQLTGNGLNLIVPGGAALGAAVQYRMLAASGQSTGSTVGGLAAFSVLGVGGLLVLPLFALPVILIGAPTVQPGLINAALLGSIGFVVFAALGAVVLLADAPLAWFGRIAQRVHNKLLHNNKRLVDFDRLLLSERDRIRNVLGHYWWKAAVLSAGRLLFDYLCLLAAIRATGAHPRPSLVLIAYAAAGIVGLIPITPGGLGLVEASLTGLLILSGIDSGSAFLATLAYRLASYWAPLIAAPIAYAAFRVKYRSNKAGPLPRVSS